MAQEIIYTSAPRGLKKGSRGFCTVVSTAGMGANLAERLESMSGYRHAFPLNDPSVGLNPVNYAHVTTRLAGQKLHVISRVADAGQDYSGRTNKLAHHIVIDNPATLTAGPARVLADPSAVVSGWDESVTTRPPRTIGNPVIPDSIKLTAWNAAAGDNSWAGYVAEQLLSSRAPVNIIFAPGTDTLALVQDVLDLVPIPQRWTVTFSTYFTRLLAGTECQLRFILAGTTEETSLRNDARAVTVDLTTTLPAASGGRLVDAARSGCLDFKQADQRSDEKPRSAASTQPPIVSDKELAGLLDDDSSVAVDTDEESQTPVTRAPVVPHAVGRRDSPHSSRLDSVFDANVQKSGRWITVSIVLLLLGGVGAGAYLTVPTILRTWQQRQALHNQMADSAGAEADSPAQATPVVNKPPVVIPFDGKSPFEPVKTGEPAGELPPLADATRAEILQILTNSPERVDLKLLSDNLTLKKNSGDPGVKWTVVNKTTSDSVGVFEVTSQESKEGQILVYHWNNPLTSDDTEFRGDEFFLQDARLQITAPLNSNTEGEDTFEVRLKIPDLFGGKGPLDNFAQAETDGPFQWDAENKKTNEIVIYTHSWRSVRFAVEGQSLEMLESGDEWQVKFEDTSVGRFIVEEDFGNGLQVHWQWDGATDADSAFWNQKYPVRAARFTLSAKREDRADESRKFALQFPGPDVFGGHKSNDQFLLPNPLISDSVSNPSPPTLNLWKDEDVFLSFHPDFKKLISNPEQRLELTKNGENNTWTVAIVNGSDNDGNERQKDQVADPQRRIPLAEYSLVPVPAGGGRFRIEFHWLLDAKRELPSAELVRWCPLIVKVGAEHRVFIQREADPWVIPSWDQQKGFVMEQAHTWNNNRTGAEFADLNLQGGDDAFFELTYTLPADEAPKSVSFSVPLKAPVAQNPEERSSQNIDHFVWCPLDNISAIQTGNHPESGEICVLHTVIRLPEARSEHPNFGLETTAYVRLNVERFDKPEPEDLPDVLQAPDLPDFVYYVDKNKKKWKSPGKGGKRKQSPDKEGKVRDEVWKNEWKDGDVTPPWREFGFVEATKVKKRFEEQIDRLRKMVKRYREWVEPQIKKAEEHLTKLNLAKRKDKPEIKKQETKLDGLEKQSKTALDLQKKYKAAREATVQSPYGSATTRWQEFMESFEKVRLRLTLGVKLKGTQPTETTEIVFVDAQMETPDDN